MRYMNVLKCAVLVLAVIILAVPAHATQRVVYPFGKVQVAVPASQYINISASGASAKIKKSVGGPSGNSPSGSFTPDTTVTGGVLTNREVTFGPYTVATTIQIETGADPAFYSVGALAAPLPVLRTQPRIAYTQFSPVAANAAASLLASDLMNGFFTTTQATGATIALTLPTGALMEAAAGMQIGQAFEWSLINLSAAAADSVTITAASGHTIVGAPIVISLHVTTGGAITSMGCNSSRWLTRKTATDTFVTYRIQ